MTPEEQRIAIAEACGLEVIKVPFIPNRVNRDAYFTKEAARALYRQYPRGKTVRALPDYLNDLNAMHEAEKMLTRAEWSIYTAMINSGMAAGTQGICQAICHATAAQRADAFLRTVGKRKDKL